MATYLDRQERLFFWYRNRARKDYYVQGWKRGRIYADFVVTLRPDEPETDDAFHRVYVLETKGMHLKHAADTEYKRSVFDLCSEHAPGRTGRSSSRPCAIERCASRSSTRTSGSKS